MRRPLVGLAVLALSLALAGCVDEAPAPVDSEPIGPVPAPTGPLTLERVAGILTEDDAPATTSLTVGTTISTSGADLTAESDYWIAVGGRPDVCADVVAAPYLVSSADAGSDALLDDRTALLGTITELDEDRFGLLQVYGRQFDDETAARAFLADFQIAVAGCPAYQFVDDGAVTYDAVALSVEQLAGTEDSTVTALAYHETLGDAVEHRTSVYFLQRDGLVLSVYGEVFPSSTLTEDDVESIAGKIALRMTEL